MDFKKLDKLLRNDSSVFHCKEIAEPSNEKAIPIRHLAGSGLTSEEVDKLNSVLGHIQGLSDFYKRYSDVSLFRDPVSGDTAYYIASPEHWSRLEQEFTPWIEDVDPNDHEDLLPAWIDSYCVIGERPGTGNYYLLPTEGESAGSVFEFEHDGFEFIQLSDNFPSFIDYLVTVDEEQLEDIASAVRFMDQDDPMTQWIISSYNDGEKTISLDREGCGYRLKINCTENEFTSKEKTTKLAKFDLPESSSNGCSTIQHTEVKLPNGDAIVVVCEMNNYGSSLSVYEQGDSPLGGARLLSVRSERGFSARCRFNKTIELFFELAE